MTFAGVVGTEVTKLRRSKVTWITLAAYTAGVAMVGSFMWMIMNPDVAKNLGLLTQKAQFAFGGETLDWKSFLRFVVEMGGLGGLLVFSVIVSFVFGREYVEGTAKNMLALPIPRGSFVLAKLIVSAIWFSVLTAWMITEAFVVGSLLGIPGLTTALFVAAAKKIAVLALMSLCTDVLVAWVAVETRGYFAPMGFAMVTLVLASLFGHTGWGPWAPWSIIGLYSGAAGPDIALSWGSYAVVAATLVIGAALVVRHEVFADNAQ